MKTTSEILKEIGGVILIKVGEEDRLYAIEDLKHTNELTIGQMVLGIYKYTGKSAKDYTNAIHYKDVRGYVDSDFVYHKLLLSIKKNDYEKLEYLFKWYSEEMPQCIPVEEVKEKLKVSF